MTSQEEERQDETSSVSDKDTDWDRILGEPTARLFPKMSQVQLQQLSPTALAYLGDAVYELYIRRFYLLPPQRPEAYHRLVVSQVRAETQAEILQSLYPHLRSAELEIVRKGRNAATGRPKRLDPATYQQASSLETLIGYLYLSDFQRLAELLQKLQLERP